MPSPTPSSSPASPAPSSSPACSDQPLDVAGRSSGASLVTGPDNDALLGDTSLTALGHLGERPSTTVGAIVD